MRPTFKQEWTTLCRRNKQISNSKHVIISTWSRIFKHRNAKLNMNSALRTSNLKRLLMEATKFSSNKTSCSRRKASSRHSNLNIQHIEAAKTKGRFDSININTWLNWTRTQQTTTMGIQKLNVQHVKSFWTRSSGHNMYWKQKQTQLAACDPILSTCDIEMPGLTELDRF